MDASRISGAPGTAHIQGHSGDSSAQQPSRPISPRRVPTNELLQSNLQRFVRKEKETPLPSHDPVNVPHVSSAMHKLNVEKNRLATHQKKYEEQLQQGNKPAPIKTSEANIDKLKKCWIKQKIPEISAAKSSRSWRYNTQNQVATVHFSPAHPNIRWG
ncbi:hypothetical protein [Burkholderia stagnalis]|uniref:hypothetical protein n=1 Tax=Burkholderia stagnalis TaxID=1503054 RepID=UPI000F58733F|nr:hypothetical protein [Burkholderia stagnalis]